MSEPTSLPRPRQVTLAGWLITGGSALVVLSLFEQMAGLNSLETRESVEQFLADVPGTGLDVSGALDLLRAMMLVSGGCAAAAVVLGVHVLRRSNGARVALSVLAVPLFVTGLLTGGVLSSVVAGAVVLLWLEPSRDWFAGRPARELEPRQRPESRDDAAASAREDARSAPADGPAWTPRPHPGFGAAPGSGTSGSSQAPTPEHAGVPTGAPVPPGAPPPHGEPAPYAPPVTYGAPPHPAPARRPAAVLWACVLTWVCSGLAAAMMGLVAVVVAAAPDLVFDQLQQQNPELAGSTTQASLASAAYVVGGVTVVWSAVACVLAVLVFRRRPWARVALVGCATGAGAVLVLGVVSSFVLVLPLAACVATVVLLMRPDVRRWSAGR